ncbi:MAG: hypothetical protein AABY07_00780 [Nanoarchaeota archaeon]
MYSVEIKGAASVDEQTFEAAQVLARTAFKAGKSVSIYTGKDKTWRKCRMWNRDVVKE